MATVECRWCHNDKVPVEEAWIVRLFGKDYIVCSQDYQLIWQGLTWLRALGVEFKAASLAAKR
jgi:hypothetical protein